MNNRLRLLRAFSLFLIVVFPGASEAQSPVKFKLSGSVRGVEGLGPLSGATIRIMGTSLGTTTNADGVYRLLLPRGNYRIVFSYVGFRSDSVSIAIGSEDATLNVSLPRGEVSLPEVVVYPESFNQADEIIRRAIAAKEKWTKKLDSYEFDAYTKTVLRVDTGRKSPPIAGILETQTKGYWQYPDRYREVITAKRQTANFTSNQNVFTVGRVLNFNDNIVRIDRYSIPGPTSPSAFKRYRFVMLDTLGEGDNRVFRIEVVPKDNPSPVFKGIIEISGSSYALLHSRLTLSDPVALDPIEDVVYDEEFAEYDNLCWLPIDIKTSFAVKFVFPPVPTVFFQNTSVLYDYRINEAMPKGVFSRDFVFAHPRDVSADSSAWKDQQVLPLTREEVRAYERLDSLTRNLPVFWKVLLYLTRLPDQSFSLPFTSFSDFYHFNRVEGNYLGVGLTSGSYLGPVGLKAITGYGFADRMWKYDFRADYDFPLADGLTVGGSVFRRLSNREEEDIYSRFEVTVGALLYRDDYRDYYLSRGWSGNIKLRLNSSLDAGVRYENAEQTSVTTNTDYSIFSENHSYRPNPSIDEGMMRSLELSLSLDTRKRFDSDMSMQSNQGSSYWVCNASLEVSSPRYLSSSFSFERYHAGAMRHQMTFASSFVDVWLIGGFSRGNLPIQRMFEIQTAYGGYAEQQVLSTLAIHRLLSGRTIVGGIEQDFPSNLFRWSNLPVIRDIWFDLTLFAHGAVAAGYQPMGEVGFGLLNVIPFIRTDFTWGVAGLCKGFAWTVETTLDL